MVAVSLFSAYTTFVTFSSSLETAFGSVLPATTIEKRTQSSFDSAFVGDRSQAGVPVVALDDRSLVHQGGISRRPVKIQMWCSAQGPSSMIPWYNTHNGGAAPATHWTWGENPPRGTLMELLIDWETEFINHVAYSSCGKEGHKRICLLYISKKNRNNDHHNGFITCGDDSNDGRSRSAEL